MGLVSGLLLLPLAPVRGTAWIADHLLQEARRQTHDPRAVQARLAALNRALDEGAIDEAAFEREEERLLDLLERPTRPPRPTRPTGGTTTTDPHPARRRQL
ncbi:gas vesicle protein GvpG [Streptomyces sp. BK79]|uniref:gas vesicle protein GvpG n=1 Tax=Streptomyces sp. BK79 TaxID=3350097 RepID=UPI00377034EE